MACDESTTRAPRAATQADADDEALATTQTKSRDAAIGRRQCIARTVRLAGVAIPPSMTGLARARLPAGLPG
jgi:hypothetical protein